MFFKNIKLKNSKAFNHVNLNELWDEFDLEEREFLYNSYKTVNMDILNHYFLDDSQLKFISNILLWLQSKRKDKTTQKVIDYVNKNNIYLKSKNAEDKHYYLLEVIKFYYHPRSPEIYNPELVKKYSYEDIEIFTKNINVFKSYGKLANNPSFKILALILEKEKNYKEAIKICELAIKYKQNDKTKGGFEGRIEKLNKNYL